MAQGIEVNLLIIECVSVVLSLYLSLLLMTGRAYSLQKRIV